VNFETYLREALGKEIAEFRLSASLQNGKTVFLIHPLNVNGLTLDFEADGNQLNPIGLEPFHCSMDSVAA
jgi:hypothetical protein